MKSLAIKKNEEAVSPVIGVILMVAIVVILAAVIGSYVFGIGPPKQAPDLYFSDVTAYTDGNLSATVIGSANVTLGSLKWFVQDTEVATSSIYVNGAVGDANTYISGGDRVIIVIGGTANYWLSGQEIRVTISDVATGQLIFDATVRVASSSS